MTFLVHMLTAAAVRSSVRPCLIAGGPVRLRPPGPGGKTPFALPPDWFRPPQIVSNSLNDSDLTN